MFYNTTVVRHKRRSVGKVDSICEIPFFLLLLPSPEQSGYEFKFQYFFLLHSVKVSVFARGEILEVNNYFPTRTSPSWLRAWQGGGEEKVEDPEEEVLGLARSQEEEEEEENRGLG